ELLEPDKAVAFGIGVFEVEEALFPRDVAVEPDQKSMELFRIDEAIAVEIARIECPAQLRELLVASVWHRLSACPGLSSPPVQYNRFGGCEIPDRRNVNKVIFPVAGRPTVPRL